MQYGTPIICGTTHPGTPRKCPVSLRNHKFLRRHLLKQESLAKWGVIARYGITAINKIIGTARTVDWILITFMHLNATHHQIILHEEVNVEGHAEGVWNTFLADVCRVLCELSLAGSCFSEQTWDSQYILAWRGLKVSQPEDLQTGNQPGSTVPKQGGRYAKVRFGTPLHLFSFTRNHFQKGKAPRCSQVRDYIN